MIEIEKPEKTESFSRKVFFSMTKLLLLAGFIALAVIAWNSIQKTEDNIHNNKNEDFNHAPSCKNEDFNPAPNCNAMSKSSMTPLFQDLSLEIQAANANILLESQRKLENIKEETSSLLALTNNFCSMLKDPQNAGNEFNIAVDIRGKLKLIEIIQNELKPRGMNNFTVHIDNNGIFQGALINSNPTGILVRCYKTLDRHTGGFLNGFRNGPGTFIKADGSKSEGYFADNMLQGQGIEQWQDGQFFFGNFRSGDLIRGFHQLNPKEIYYGELRNRKPNGAGCKIAGNIAYCGQWSDGLMSGTGLIFEDLFSEQIGDVHRGGFLNNLRHGKWVTVRSDGTTESHMYEYNVIKPIMDFPKKLDMENNGNQFANAKASNNLQKKAGEIGNADKLDALAKINKMSTHIGAFSAGGSDFASLVSSCNQQFQSLEKQVEISETKKQLEAILSQAKDIDKMCGDLFIVTSKSATSKKILDVMGNRH